MNIIDEKVRKMIDKLDMPELTESIYTWDENERDGRTDLELLKHEVEHFYELYLSDGTIFYEDLVESKQILRETKYGKVIPCWKDTLKPIYSENRILQVKNTVNEFNRLKRLYEKLNK